MIALFPVGFFFFAWCVISRDWRTMSAEKVAEEDERPGPGGGRFAGKRAGRVPATPSRP